MADWLYFDQDLFQDLKKQVDTAYSSLDSFYIDLKKYYRFLENDGDSEVYTQLAGDLLRLVKRLQNTTVYLEEYWKDKHTSLDKTYLEDMGIDETYQGVYGVSWDDIVSPDYSVYLSWQFMQSGGSFLTQYSDLYSYMDTANFKTAQFYFMNSLVSDYPTYVHGLSGEYAERLLDDALAGIVESIPGFDEKYGLTATSVDGAYEDLFGKDGFEYIKRASGELTEWLKLGKSFEEMQEAQWYRFLREQMSYGGQERFDEWMKDLCEAYPKAAKTFDTATEAAEWCLQTLEFILKGCSTYETQVRYLTAIQDSLLASGFTAGAVYHRINEMRERYNDSWAVAWEKFKPFLEKKTVKFGINTLAKEFPTLKGVDLGLKTISLTAKKLGGESVGAAKSLLGLSQCDRALTQSYENYMERLSEGLATKEEAQQAEAMYEVLIGVKIREYKEIINIGKHFDEDVAGYEKKLRELQKMQEEIQKSRYKREKS